MQLGKDYIEIDASPWMGCEGVESSVFLGDSGDPVFSKVYTYEELIFKELNSLAVHKKIRGPAVDDAQDFVDALHKAASYADKLFKELKED